MSSSLESNVRKIIQDYHKKLEIELFENVLTFGKLFL